MSPFDPAHLTPPISLNRVIVADLPGIDVDAGVTGKSGYELISSYALAGLIRRHSEALNLDPAQPDHVLNRALDDCLVRESPAAEVAETIARRIGRNLGYLLLALRRGDAVNRAARDEWDDSYWAHWATIRQVWLGGGIVSGRLGARLCRYALDIFAEAGTSDYSIRLSPYGVALPLVGMARRAPANCPMAYVFDFGQTVIKRGRAIYEQDVLRALERFSDVETGWGDVSNAADDPVAKVVWLLDRMIDVINTTRTAPGPALISISAYVRDGQPIPAQRGAYVQIGRITDNMQDTLAERLGAPVVLEHDGTAAATAHAGEQHTAVITIGTALGIGFPAGELGHLRRVGADVSGILAGR